MYGRVVTTRTSTHRTPAALKPVNDRNIGERTHGDISREEARRQQNLKYREESKKFVEKEKLKAEKKREEKWKRYSHVDAGQRLNSSNQDSDSNFENIRAQQQLLYDVQAPDGLEVEREREAASLKRRDQRKEEKLKKYNHVTSGSRLGSIDQIPSQSSGNLKARQQLTANQESKRSIRGLKNEEQSRLLENSSTDVPDDTTNINLNNNYDRALKEKKKHYQEQKFKTENASQNSTSISEPSCSHVNNLTTDMMNVTVTSETNRDEENRRQMKLAREKLQKKYDETLHKSS